ncbi:MAG: 30S ribosomal protein S16 [Alphaproteobacteria bacterium]|nr:30S ribosomal protein S16 [Alphaproteobacteria bacterium]
MATVIRMNRVGTKQQAHYRIVVAHKRNPRGGRYLELLGHYHPQLPSDHKDRLVLDFDKVKAWMAKGALPSDRISKILEAKGMLPKKTRSNPEKAKPKKKAQERAGGGAPAPAAAPAAAPAQS